jgi:hypothetical protein
MVVWDDAHGCEEGWQTWQPKEHHQPRKILTVGIVLKDDDTGMALAQNKDRRARRYDHIIFVPRACIQEVTDVTPG